jgi:hypothetical protein
MLKYIKLFIEKQLGYNHQGHNKMILDERNEYSKIGNN